MATVKQNIRRNFIVLLKAGLPYTLAGIVAVFGGIWVIRRLFEGHPWQNGLLLLWLALFWFVYQPLFHRRIRQVKKHLK